MEHLIQQEKRGFAVGPSYKIQHSNFVKFIALSQWVESHLQFNEEAWTSITALHLSYTAWIRSQVLWRNEVVDTPAGFSRKLSNILVAKGVPFSPGRRKTGRGLNGVKLV